MVHPDTLQPHDDTADPPVVGFSADREKGAINARHSHARGQLVYAISGTLSVTTDDGTWVVPRERAVWVPPGIVHQVLSLTESRLRTVYVDMAVYRNLPEQCCVVQVTPLLRELIVTFLARPRDYTPESAEARLADCLVDQIAASRIAPLHLPIPGSAKLRAVAERLLDDPASPGSLHDCAAAATVSPRTFERRFRQETGMTFRTWRQQAKLMRALEFLADGQPVNDVADQLGYEGPSAFIAMFRKAFGTTPGRYFGDRPPQ